MTCPMEPSRVCASQFVGVKYSTTVPSSERMHPFIKLCTGRERCSAMLPIRVQRGDDTVVSHSMP